MVERTVEYLITDGHGNYIRYDIGTRRYVCVRSEVLAERFDTRPKAQNILNNAVSKKERIKYKVVEIVNTIIHNKVEPQAEPEEPKEEKVLHGVTASMVGEDYTDCRLDVLRDEIKNLQKIATYTEERRSQLTDGLSYVDKEISDIEHYLELRNLNEQQEHLICVMLQKKLRKRRQIKDELTVVKQIGDCRVDSVTIAEVQAAMDKLQGREYTPRVLKELFE